MNATIDKVLEYESLFERLFGTEVSLKFEAPLSEMEEAVNYFNIDLKEGDFKRCHLAHPFEDSYEQNCFRFTFISERNKDLKITVSSKEKYRINKEIVEI